MASSFPSFFLLHEQTTKFPPITRTLFRYGPREEVRISTLPQTDPGKYNCNLDVVYFMPGKAQQKLLHDFPGNVWSLKKSLIEFCHLFFSFAIHNTTQAGKFCYQRTQNLCRRCRRFRQRVCECQDCLISPHYHTCQVSLDGGSSVITLLPLLLWDGWFCYQFRDFFLLVLFFLGSSSLMLLCTCSPSAGHDTQSIQPPTSSLLSYAKNRNPGNNLR